MTRGNGLRRAFSNRPHLVAGLIGLCYVIFLLCCWLAGRKSLSTHIGNKISRLANPSNDKRYKIGSWGLIWLQAYLFFSVNFFTTLSAWWAARPLCQVVGLSAVYLVLFLVPLCMYFVGAPKNSCESAKRALLIVGIAIAAVAPSWAEPFISCGLAESTWWKFVSLFYATCCQIIAGYLAWKAADLLPARSIGKSK